MEIIFRSLKRKQEGKGNEMENNNILLVRREITFMTNALVTNLTDAGYQITEVGLDVKDISNHQSEAELLIMYADSELCQEQSTLVYLKDLCIEEDRPILLVGSRQEIEEVTSYISTQLFADVMERPLAMNSFLEKVNALMDEEQMEKRKKSILLVDDDVSYLQLLREWLKSDYRVGMARSGMQAITWLARNHVDLILLDYEMPVTDGAQVFEMLKSEPYSKDIPVMFLTGKSDKESIMKVAEFKPAGYMLKSISRRALMTNINKFFTGQKYNA